MKNKKSTEQLLKEDTAEMIYSALINWDMNPMTKGFAKELARDIVNRIKERVGYWL